MSKYKNRLSRSLRTHDAVFIGLGSMIGAGIFTALAPAASVAQAGLIFGLVIAACVALFNASSSAQLARLYPASGGTYVYAKERLNDFWAWCAGWGFIFGKLASCAAVALTFGYYLSPDYARYLAATAVIVFMIINYMGIKKTANATKVIVGIVLLSLLAIVALVLSDKPSLSNLQPLFGQSGLYGILQSAGIWFFAFAGYSRIATLGEEIKDPEKSIPRAILIGLGLTLAIYAAVVLSALLVVGPATLAQSNSPLVTAVQQAGFDNWQWLVKVGSTFATLGVLLSLMTGVSRTVFAMAADKKLPSYLASVHKTNKVPHLAEITVGLIIAVVVLLVDVRAAIGFSAFTVLLYYTITNMSAFTLKSGERLFSKSLAVFGIIGCLVLAFTLPIQSVVMGSGIMLLGIVVYALRVKRKV
ncbi:amino acid permease [Streptomyces caniscabiei]|uniref:APC family permease n=1 Tax=Streptomyces caniscabiei TaxID=2746961 RepID=UPI0029A5EA9A|nr:amino acid permease [Streptomyces caniscabiei]MDX2775811.1 amino acid permease [Streptomyces caniscabiei]